MATGVLFIYPRINQPPDCKTMLELGIYVARLRQYDFKVTVWTIQDHIGIEEIAERIRAESPRLVFYYIEPLQYSFLKEIAPPLKEAFLDLHFCCGGLMPTLDPDGVISNLGVDSIVVGEGDVALVDFVNSHLRGKQETGIRNFWFKSALMEISKNPLRPLEEDLDQIPFSDRSCFDMKSLLRFTGGALPVYASRGCRFNCIFCSCPRLRDIYQGKGSYSRVRSVDNIIREILDAREKYEFSQILFTDDIFPTSEKWIEEFAESYLSRVKMPFQISSAIEQLDDKTLELLVMAGCSRITLGIETGNESFRKRLCNRNLGNDKIRDAVHKIKDMGLEVHGTCMIGLPLENQELAGETVEFLRDLPLDRVSVRIYDPVPGTPLYTYCREKGYLTDKNPLTRKEEESLLALPYLSDKDIRRFYFRIRQLNGQCRIRRIGKKRGYFDFIGNLASLQSEGMEDDQLYCDEFTIGGVTHSALVQKPNTKLIVPVELKEKVYLHFGTGLEPTMREFDPEVYFRFTLVLIQDKNEKTIFEKYLIPGKDPRDLEWYSYELPVLDFVEGPAQLKMEYRTSLKSTLPVRGLWVRPYLSERMARPDDEMPFTEEEFSRIKKENLQAGFILKRVMEEKTALSRENEELKKKLEDILQLAGKLEKKVLRYESERERLNDHISSLEKIRKAYYKTLTGRLKRLFRKP